MRPRPDLIVCSGMTVRMALSRPIEPGAILERLGETARVETTPDHAIMGVVGLALAESGSLRGRVLNALARLGPEMMGLGASAISVTAVVPQARLREAVCELHRQFFEEGCSR